MPRSHAGVLMLVVLSACAPVMAAAQTAASSEVVAEVRIRGNYRTPDDDVLRLAGITIGGAVGSGTLDEVSGRLRKSGRFESVEIRKRYRSLTEGDQIAVIIIVQERPGVDKGGFMPSPLKRIGNTMMALPALDYVDGYGFTGGGRLSFVNVLGKEGHVVMPLTVGSTREAAVEIDKTIRGGPIRRLHGGLSVASRENPAFDLRDRRTELWMEGARPFRSFFSVGARIGWSDVAFGEVRDRFTSYGAHVAVDTRTNPVFPRNAVYASAHWNALRPESGVTINRYTLDGRAYVGLPGSSVILLRARTETADRAVPIYERQLLGGIDSLRGLRAGSFTGDNMAAASLELRVPVHTPMSIGQAGFKIFTDAGTAYDHGTRIEDAELRYGVGGGWYLRLPPVQLDVDVARSNDRAWRLHVAFGVRF